MARRRLQMILATTTITVGLAAAPAAAQDLIGEATSTVEDTVTTVEETTTEVVDTVEETVSPSTSETDEPLLDVEEGTGDGTLDVDLEVDVAPSDDDGSPQLEVDGGATVGGETVDVGSATDPIEDAVDPDPAPAPEQREPGNEGETSSDAEQPRARHTGPGGVLEGGGVVAAGTGTRPVEAPGDTPAARSLGSGFAAFGALDRGGFGFSRHGGGTMSLDAVPDPEVAPPAVAEAPVETPQVLDPEFAPETPAVFASGMAPGTDDGPMSGLLKALAAAMVLGTGATWTRATRGS